VAPVDRRLPRGLCSIDFLGYPRSRDWGITRGFRTECRGSGSGWSRSTSDKKGRVPFFWPATNIWRRPYARLLKGGLGKSFEHSKCVSRSFCLGLSVKIPSQIGQEIQPRRPRAIGNHILPVTSRKWDCTPYERKVALAKAPFVRANETNKTLAIRLERCWSFADPLSLGIIRGHDPRDLL